MRPRSCTILVFFTPCLLQAAQAVPLKSSVIANYDEPTSAKVERYAATVVDRYDANRDGILQPGEWRPMQGEPRLIDRDEDRQITVGEFTLHILRFANGKRLVPTPDLSATARNGDDPSNNARRPADAGAGITAPRGIGKTFYVPERLLPEGVPDWFHALDLNGDAQLTPAEFNRTGQQRQASSFERIDANGDGLMTPREAVRGGAQQSLQKKGTDASPPDDENVR